MAGRADAEARARAWRSARAAQRVQDQRAREALSRVAGGEIHSPLSLHPLRMMSPFPSATTDGPADVSWNPIDLYAPNEREP